MKKKFIKGAVLRPDFNTTVIIKNRLNILRLSMNPDEDGGLELPSLGYYGETGEFVQSLLTILYEERTGDLDNVVEEVYEFAQSVDVFEFVSTYRTMYFDLYRTDPIIQVILGIVFSTIFSAYSRGSVIGINSDDESVLISEGYSISDLEISAMLTASRNVNFLIDDRGKDIIKEHELEKYINDYELHSLQKQMGEMDEFLIAPLLERLVSVIPNQVMMYLFNEINDTNQFSGLLHSDNQEGTIDLESLVIVDGEIHMSPSHVFLCCTLIEALESSCLEENIHKVPDQGVVIDASKLPKLAKLETVTLKKLEFEGRNALGVSTLNQLGQSGFFFITEDDVQATLLVVHDEEQYEAAWIALAWLGILDDVEVTKFQVIDSMSRSGLIPPAGLPTRVAVQINEYIEFYRDGTKVVGIVIQ